MDFQFTKEQEEFRQEIHKFNKNTPKDEIDPKLGYSPLYYEKVAEKQWFGLHMPMEYDGRSRSIIDSVIFTEEMAYLAAPIPIMAIAASEYLWGGIILKYGSEQMKRQYLPQIAQGRLRIGQAFTETEAGCDLFYVQTRALRKGNHYVVNGQKMFCSSIHQGEHQFLLAVTDAKAPPEKGLSFFILNPESQGIYIVPMVTISGWRTNQVFLDDVHIPAEDLVGEENKAWSYFTEHLPFYWHRHLGGQVGLMRRIFEAVVHYVKNTRASGRLLCHDQLIRQKLAQMAIDIKVIRILLYRMAWMYMKGLSILSSASMLSVHVEEALFRFANYAMQCLGLCGQLSMDSECSPLDGMIELLYRQNATRLWANEGGAAAVKNYISYYVLGFPVCYSYMSAKH